MTAFLVASCGVFGLLVGSFLNVVVWRVPRGESVVHPRSRCPGCGNQLRSVDNVPVLSWLFLRGRCHFCGEPISGRYPLVELLTGVVFAVLAAKFGYDWALPAFLVMAAGLTALSFIDLDTHRLPNKVVYPTLFATAPLFVLAGAASGEWGHVGRAAAGGVIAFLVLFVIHVAVPRGMGFGDVRLSGVIGTGLGWLGLAYVAVGLFFAFLTSAVVGLGLIAVGIKTRKDHVPFGPFLALGWLLAVLLGHTVLHWYHV